MSIIKKIFIIFIKLRNKNSRCLFSYLYTLKRFYTYIHIYREIDIDIYIHVYIYTYRYIIHVYIKLCQECLTKHPTF